MSTAPMQVNMAAADTSFLVPMQVAVSGISTGMVSSTNVAPLPPPQPYEGDYVVTPTQSTQTLSTAGMKMTGNVTINPIPNNYGLITWNGSIITVS